MVNLTRSDQFSDILKGDEFNLDVFGLVGNQVRDLADILG
jgi:hypothetical protein